MVYIKLLGISIDLKIDDKENQQIKEDKENQQIKEEFTKRLNDTKVVMDTSKKYFRSIALLSSSKKLHDLFCCLNRICTGICRIR